MFDQQKDNLKERILKLESSVKFYDRQLQVFIDGIVKLEKRIAETEKNIDNLYESTVK